LFCSDGSAAIELEEIQQMFYVYYGYKGRDLDDKVNSFSRLRKKDGEIDFSEFLELMDEIGLTPVIGDSEQVTPQLVCVCTVTESTKEWLYDKHNYFSVCDSLTTYLLFEGQT